MVQASVYSDTILLVWFILPSKAHFLFIWRFYQKSGLIGGLQDNMCVVLGHLAVTEEFHLTAVRFEAIFARLWHLYTNHSATFIHCTFLWLTTSMIQKVYI